ncbi:MAG: elongation factor P 5-aminopentanone reductase [Oscillospiraceae bacterium]
MKTALITGATGDIGSDIVRILSLNNYNIAIHYNKNENQAKKLKNLCFENNVKAEMYKCDLRLNKDVEKMVFNIIKDFKKIDILVNNAGVSEIKMFQDISEKDWDFVLDTNLKSVYNVCSYVIPNMVKLKFGKIINISSVWGINGASCEVHYSTSKAGLIGFTKALAKEISLSGVNVNCIAPGVISGKMTDNLNNEDKNLLIDEILLNKIGLVSDVSETVLFLCNRSGDYYTGQILSPNGGLVI